MTDYLLDTNAIASHLRNNKGPVSVKLASLGNDYIHISSVTRAELVFGALHSKDPMRHQLHLNTFLANINEIPFDRECANEYGEIRADLERRGLRISSNDVMIAATAKVHGLILVTHNTREFVRVPGLQIEDWELP